jgi:hypothetical protein
MGEFVAAGISMVRFAQADNRNILETGEINLVIQHVDALPGTPQAKIEMLLDCLSQTFFLRGASAGKCESVLKRELFARATAFHNETQQTVEKAAYKYDPKLVDVIKKMRLLASGVLNTNLTEFSDPHHTNILEAGSSSLVIGVITNNPAISIGVQIQALLDCLAQAHVMGGRYAGKCESDFKARIYALAQANPAEVQTFIQNNPGLKEDTRFKDVIKTMVSLATRDLNIDMAHFSDGVSNDVDILKSGKINLVIAYITHNAPNPQAQFEALLHCYSQAVYLGGQFQGLCESQLLHTIYQLTLAHRAAAQAVTGLPQFKYDPKLSSLLQNICQLIRGNPAINMSKFLTPDGFVDLLETGQIDLVRHFIDNNAPNVQDRIGMFLNCLSQTLQRSGRNRGACESALKASIYQLVKRYPLAAQEIIQGNEYKYDSNIRDVIKTIDYLSSGIFGYRGWLPNYFRKAGHHLYETFTNNRSYAVTSLSAGTSLLLTGGLQVVFSDTADIAQKKAGWAMIGTGSGILGLPIVNALYLGSKDEV